MYCINVDCHKFYIPLQLIIFVFHTCMYHYIEGQIRVDLYLYEQFLYDYHIVCHIM